MSFETSSYETLCECGHKKSDHIYCEGACRPGFACSCQGFKPKSAKQPEKIYVLYDGRANVMPTDECAVLCVAHSKSEIMRDSREHATLDVWFQYDMNDQEALVNEERLGTCEEFLKGQVTL